MKADKTIQYYDENAVVFASETLNADMREFYVPFLKRIPKGGKILDAGCGSGRDSLYFKKQGFKVTAMDGSKKMCEEAEKVLNQPVLCSTFEELEETQEYDGIWACASLLHVEKDQMTEMMNHLAGTLKPGGIFYACWQKGNSERMVGDRYYADYVENQLKEMLKQVKSCRLVEYWESEDVLQDPPRTKKWLNVIMEKQRIDK